MEDKGTEDDKDLRGLEVPSGAPLGVAVGLADGVLALAQSVPQLDRLVAAARDDLCGKPSSGNVSYRGMQS